MNAQAFYDALDRAMTKVAIRQFEQLSYNMRPDEKSLSVYNSVEALKSLSRGSPPVYDNPWISLFYMTWYQPRQIQLARSMIGEYQKQKYGDKLLNSPNLRVIDYGCGSLAMKFAVTWAVAEAMEKGDRIISVRVDSHDPSISMVQLGNVLWWQFEEEVLIEPELSQLREVFRMIDSQYTMPNFMKESENAVEDRWLTSIHAIYGSNMELVKENLYKLYSIFEPNALLMTVHGDGSQRYKLSKVAQHVIGKSTPAIHPVAHTLPTNNVLHRVTEWRSRLNSQFEVGHSYLNGEVSSWFSDAAGLVLLRQA